MRSLESTEVARAWPGNNNSRTDKTELIEFHYIRSECRAAMDGGSGAVELVRRRSLAKAARMAAGISAKLLESALRFERVFPRLAD